MNGDGHRLQDRACVAVFATGVGVPTSAQFAGYLILTPTGKWHLIAPAGPAEPGDIPGFTPLFARLPDGVAEALRRHRNFWERQTAVALPSGWEP